MKLPHPPSETLTATPGSGSGRARSIAKTASARVNGKKGGRPRRYPDMVEQAMEAYFRSAAREGVTYQQPDGALSGQRGSTVTLRNVTGVLATYRVARAGEGWRVLQIT